jgi:hypothetical protein
MTWSNWSLQNLVTMATQCPKIVQPWFKLVPLFKGSCRLFRTVWWRPIIPGITQGRPGNRTSTSPRDRIPQVVASVLVLSFYWAELTGELGTIGTLVALAIHDPPATPSLLLLQQGYCCKFFALDNGIRHMKATRSKPLMISGHGTTENETV